MKKNNYQMRMVSVGMLVSSVPFVFLRFMQVSIPDFANGLLRGIGLGIMLLALIHPKFRRGNRGQSA